MSQKFIIVRGLPGSGKSTVARQICHSMTVFERVSIICEADDYFMVNGVYNFDVSKLPQAHNTCFSKAVRAMEEGNNVIVSNTFTSIKELRPYFMLAKRNSIVPQVIVCQSNYGSIHGVPEESMRKMKARFVYNIDELYAE